MFVSDLVKLINAHQAVDAFAAKIRLDGSSCLCGEQSGECGKIISKATAELIVFRPQYLKLNGSFLELGV
ncbi:hypothetical protein [Methylocystis parvus]|uniref:hypothetical protein n=1 Tax=Methylocystis parvus TaxID=134 RepID=UPI0012FA11FE|nr:hypothetical protein [Methylocystis parvus]WBJ99058.1 hypothetical protein MMG94_13755 [Methylocystis parvus OBBP]